jgi:hypothetical protein
MDFHRNITSVRNFVPFTLWTFPRESAPFNGFCVQANLRTHAFINIVMKCSQFIQHLVFFKLCARFYVNVCLIH